MISDDCVSRAEVIKVLDNHWLSGSCSRRIIDEQIDKVKALPPVTPTHGKCKDCTNYVVGALDEEICLRGHELIYKDFYCADYEKRGNEND